jgi:hypothetical protein
VSKHGSAAFAPMSLVVPAAIQPKALIRVNKARVAAPWPDDG